MSCSGSAGRDGSALTGNTASAIASGAGAGAGAGTGSAAGPVCVTGAAGSLGAEGSFATAGSLGAGWLPPLTSEFTGVSTPDGTLVGTEAVGVGAGSLMPVITTGSLGES